MKITSNDPFIEVKLNNLSKEKQEQELKAIKGNHEIIFIDIGRK